MLSRSSAAADVSTGDMHWRRDDMHAVDDGSQAFLNILLDKGKKDESCRAPNRTYVLVDSNGGNRTTVTVPWIAAPAADDGVFPYTSAENYHAAWCVRGEPGGEALIRAARRSGVFGFAPRAPRPWAAPRGIGIMSHRPLPPAEKFRPFNLLAATQLASARRAMAALPRSTPPALRRRAATRWIPIDLDSPVLADDDTAFYVLQRETGGPRDAIGVWVFPTLSPDGEFDEAVPRWLTAVTAGLRALEEQKIGWLIVDVSGNPGGYFCTGTALAELRLTPTVTALLQSSALPLTDPAISPVDARLTAADVVAERGAYLQDRGGGPQNLSAFFRFCRNPGDGEALAFRGLPALDRGWAPDRVAVISDGRCGSACACWLRTLRDSHGVRAFTYAGAMAKPYTPTSYEGGIVVPFDALAVEAGPDLTAAERALLPRNFSVPVLGQLPLTQGYSPKGKAGATYPAEWVPQVAEEHVVVPEPWVWTAVWEAVAERLVGEEDAAATATADGATTIGRAAAVDDGRGLDGWLERLFIRAVDAGLVEIGTDEQMLLHSLSLTIWLKSTKAVDLFLHKASFHVQDTTISISDAVNIALLIATILDSSPLVFHLLDTYREHVVATFKGFREDCTALHYAVKPQNVEVVRALLDETSTKHLTPLIRAISLNSLEICTVILEHRPDLTPANTFGWPCLHHVVHLDSTNVLELVCAHIGENSADPEWKKPDIDAKGLEEITPLMLAVHDRKLEAVKLLLALGANVLVRNSHGHAPIDHAFLRKDAENSTDFEMATLLLQPVAALKREGRLCSRPSSQVETNLHVETDYWYDVVDAYNNCIASFAMRQVFRGFAEFEDDLARRGRVSRKRQLVPQWCEVTLSYMLDAISVSHGVEFEADSLRFANASWSLFWDVIHDSEDDADEDEGDEDSDNDDKDA
ncbi:hypothetical protein HDU96_002397 [Phlyctochytrium bullatum]|nr:hypothetical protein HDU96_002397 [Phlyctochytrium bullatum]